MKTKLGLLAFLVIALSSFEAFAAKANPSELIKETRESGFREALIDYVQTRQGTTYDTSYDGEALKAYLLFKNGLPVMGIEHLMSLKNPSQISSEVRALWTKDVKADHPVWKVARTTWGAKWDQFFGQSVGREVALYSIYTINSAKELKKIQTELSNTSSPTQKTWLQWQLGLWAPVYDQVNVGIFHLENLLKSKQEIIGRDQILMALARAHFQKNEFEKAVEYYTQVPKSSDFWFESVEERAWAAIREGRYEKALADATTLTTPVFTPLIGPEPYFMAAYSGLKICDYPMIFKFAEKFKERFKKTSAGLEELVKTGTSAAVQKALAKLVKGDLSIATYGTEAQFLPRNFHHDEFVRRHLLYRKALLLETARTQEIIENLQDKNLTMNILNSRIQSMQTKATASEKLALNRIQRLAQEDLKEIKANLQKMHIIEAEVIQRIHLAQKPGKNNLKLSKASDELVFPYDDDEVWMDELDNYKSLSNGCPVKETKEGRL